MFAFPVGKAQSLMAVRAAAEAGCSDLPDPADLQFHKRTDVLGQGQIFIVFSPAGSDIAGIGPEGSKYQADQTQKIQDAASDKEIEYDAEDGRIQQEFIEIIHAIAADHEIVHAVGEASHRISELILDVIHAFTPLTPEDPGQIIAAPPSEDSAEDLGHDEHQKYPE